MKIEPNALETFIEKNYLDPIETMNTLQNEGMISDNCVTAADVADSDAVRAVSFLFFMQ